MRIPSVWNLGVSADVSSQPSLYSNTLIILLLVRLEERRPAVSALGCSRRYQLCGIGSQTAGAAAALWAHRAAPSHAVTPAGPAKTTPAPSMVARRACA